jgi:IS1 family transposase
MNRLTDAERVQVIACICEGNSIRSTVRITGVAKNTVAKLLVDIGNACIDYQDRVFRNLRCKRIQRDEIWSFVYAKEKNVPAKMSGKFGVGDVWTWVAIDADTKLVPWFMVGNRDGQTAKLFLDDLASRLASRVQLTTDGLKAYLEAVEGAFGSEIDYAMLVKLYSAATKEEARRYSPAECIGCEKQIVMGQPDPKLISTSYSERQNLSMRMMMRRFTRLTNAFSKKVENHLASVALYFMCYNFVRIHQTLRMTPAMAAGVTDRLWEISDIVGLLNKNNSN